MLTMATAAGAADFYPDKNCAWMKCRESFKHSLIAGATPLVLDYGSQAYCEASNPRCYESVRGGRAALTLGTAVLFTGADYYLEKHDHQKMKWLLRVGFWGYSIRNVVHNLRSSMRGNGVRER